MQFREQGKQIQCIRSAYDPAIKRSHQTVIATFNRSTDTIPAADMTGLTDQERQELAVWFQQRQASKLAALQQQRVQLAAQTLTDLANAIRMSNPLTNEEAVAIWQGLSVLGKVMKKAGHPKPKRA